MRGRTQGIHGILKRSWTKEIRDMNFAFNGYVHTVGDSHEIASYIFNFLFYLTIATQTFFCFSSSMWPPDTSMRGIVRTCLIAVNYFPVVNGTEIRLLIIIGYCLLKIGIHIIYGISFLSFKRSARISKTMANILGVFIDVSIPKDFLTTSVMITFSVYEIYSGNQVALALITTVLCLYVLGVQMWEHIQDISSSVLFRPTSLSILRSKTDFEVLICLCLNSILSTWGGLQGGNSGSIICMLTVFPRVAVVYLTKNRYCCSVEDDRIQLPSWMVVSALLSIIGPTIQLCGYACDEIEIFGGFILVGIAITVRKWIAKNESTKLQAILSEIENNTINFDNLDHNTALSVLFEGFIGKSRICHNFSLFEKAFSLYPNDQELILMHARFASIYSCDKSQIEAAISRMSQLKKNNYPIKFVLFQLKSIIERREQSSNKEIVRSLKKLEERSDKAKNILRFAWERILRGQLDALNESIRNLEKAEYSITIDYKQLCIINSNNPAVFLSYSKFLKEVARRYEESKVAFSIYSSLKNGGKVRGETAFHFARSMFPTIMDEGAHSALNGSKICHVSETSGSESEEDGKSAYLETMMSEVRIPSLIPSIVSSFITIVVVFSILDFILFFSFKSQTSVYSKEHSFVENLCRMRIIITELVMMTFRYQMGRIGRLGSINSTYLEDTISSACIYEQKLASSVINVPSSNVKSAFEIIFDSDINGSLGRNFSIYSYSVQAINVALSTLEMNGTDVLNWTSFWEVVDSLFTYADVSASSIYNVVYQCMENCNSFFIGFIELLFLGVILCLIPAAVALTITLFWRKHEKEAIFGSLRSIPGSAIASLLHSLSKSDGKEYKSKAEENALYSLKAYSGNSGSEAAGIAIVVGIIFTFAAALVMITDNYLAIYAVSNEIQPLIFQYFSSAEAQEAITLCFIRSEIASADDRKDNTELYGINIRESESLDSILKELWVGSESGIIGDSSSASKTISSLLSSDTNGNISYENSIVEISGLISSAAETKSLIPDSVFEWIYNTSGNSFINSAFDAIESSTTNRISSDVSILSATIFIVIISLIVVEAVLAYVLIKESNDMLYMLRLLLFCDADIALRSRSVMKVLSNEFTVNRGEEETSFDIRERVVSHLTDSVLFMTSDLIIRSCNKSTANVLGVQADDAMGKSLFDIINADKNNASFRAFKTAVDAVKQGLRPPNLNMEVEIIRNGRNSTLQFSLIAVSMTSEVLVSPTSVEAVAIFICTVSDISSTIASRNLLNSERERGAHLLSMILPQFVVKKLQKGEKNISFSVPSASVVFIDIVSFTPWCGSLPASVVMSTLNHLFGMYDKLLLKYDKMTKIKCIGDCYMAAGGLFDEVNQPSVHAKQAVSFCLDVIAGLEEFNRTHNTQLHVRAGCNTGGPIVAGVLGIDKPNFDILGPSISMAEAMEHYGVPMLVHITKSVYDLIYDEKFRLRERGETTVKGGGKVRTYLVSGTENI